MYICMYVCMYVCMHGMDVRMYVYVCIYTCVFMLTHGIGQVTVGLPVAIHKGMGVHIHVHTLMRFTGTLNRKPQSLNP